MKSEFVGRRRRTVARDKFRMLWQCQTQERIRVKQLGNCRKWQRCHADDNAVLADVSPFVSELGKRCSLGSGRRVWPIMSRWNANLLARWHRPRKENSAWRIEETTLLKLSKNTTAQELRENLEEMA